MTGFEFQKALANVIRHPNAQVSGLALAGLAPEERTRLMRMIGDPLVRKFSTKMSYCRFRDAMSVARVTRRLANERHLEQLFIDEFEPLHDRTDFDRLGISFLDTLLTSPRCRAALNLDRGYLEDAIRYDRAKAAILRSSFRADSPLPNGDTDLLHRAFTFLNLSWDISAIDKLLALGLPLPERPHPKQHLLLFLKTKAAPFYRMFQVDDTVRQYLDGESGDTARRVPRPAAYNAMVSIGLCRPGRAAVDQLANS